MVGRRQRSGSVSDGDTGSEMSDHLDRNLSNMADRRQRLGSVSSVSVSSLSSESASSVSSRSLSSSSSMSCDSHSSSSSSESKASDAPTVSVYSVEDSDTDSIIIEPSDGNDINGCEINFDCHKLPGLKDRDCIVIESSDDGLSDCDVNIQLHSTGLENDNVNVFMHMMDDVDTFVGAATCSLNDIPDLHMMDDVDTFVRAATSSLNDIRDSTISGTNQNNSWHYNRFSFVTSPDIEMVGRCYHRMQKQHRNAERAREKATKRAQAAYRRSQKAHHRAQKAQLRAQRRQEDHMRNRAFKFQRTFTWNENPYSRYNEHYGNHNGQAQAKAAYSENRQHQVNQNLQALRALYETRCEEVFTKQNDSRTLSYDDIPWPHTKNGGIDDMVEFLLGGMNRKCHGYRACLRKEKCRWHPDRFLQRCGDRLKAEDRSRILSKVKQISQILNSLPVEK